MTDDNTSKVGSCGSIGTMKVDEVDSVKVNSADVNHGDTNHQENPNDNLVNSDDAADVEVVTSDSELSVASVSSGTSEEPAENVPRSAVLSRQSAARILASLSRRPDCQNFTNRSHAMWQALLFRAHHNFENQSSDEDSDSDDSSSESSSEMDDDSSCDISSDSSQFDAEFEAGDVSSFSEGSSESADEVDDDEEGYLTRKEWELVTADRDRFREILEELIRPPTSNDVESNDRASQDGVILDFAEEKQ